MIQDLTTFPFNLLVVLLKTLASDGLMFPDYF